MKSSVTNKERVGFLLTDDSQMEEVNTKAFGKNGTTDVISFPIGQKINDHESYLGELVISCEEVLRNAKKQNVSYSAELARVVAHGVLHLVGYEDTSTEGRADMKAVEDWVVEKIEIE